MSRVVLAAHPLIGHVTPILTIAGDLVVRGHDVLVYTGARFTDRIRAIGARSWALPPEIDYDDRDFDAAFPARASMPPGPARGAFDTCQLVVAPTPAALAGLRDLLAEFPADVIITEQTFLAPAALRMADPENCPRVLTVGHVIPMFSSADVPPMGMGEPPVEGPQNRIRNRMIHEKAREVLADVYAHNAAVFASMGITIVDSVYDVGIAASDHYVQLGVPGFEYPRDDAPEHFTFGGALPPDPGDDFTEPAWWPELGKDRPVVVLTQGTLANTDPNQLLAPAVRALADLDVLVIAVTVRDDGPQLVQQALGGEVPSNVRLASYVPFGKLLPHAAVFVTNGGYGGVQTALRNGVPIVVGGATEDKPEVAARVQWSGCGIDLRTAAPDEAGIRTAVRAVLDEPCYAEAARRLGTQMASHDPLAHIAEIIAA
ncbi:MAG: glycosyltransferase [Actinomycetota bacterium]|nr:glycosyltransferase [Actinomycetota bacterium]